MFAWLNCLLDGHYWWVTGADETMFQRGTVFCHYCLKRAKKQPYITKGARDAG